MKKDFCLHGLLLCLGIAYCSHVTSLRRNNKLRQSFHGHHEKGKEGQVLHRSKRGWVWNQFFVIEEYTGPDPVLVGRLHSDVDSGDGKIKYILSGEGAGTIFVIDDKSGNIHATKTLDREERAQYTLMAQAVDRETNKPLEPPSEFIVKVQDINDNPPEFLHENYHANVPEMSNVGIIRTALPNMDREAKEEYHVVIQAKDMGGHMGGLSGTTKVTITLTDVNDNPPKFPQSAYPMSVSEAAVPGEEVGRIKAKDPDIGENGLIKYRILEGDGAEMFEITADYQTQEGVVKLKKVVDYETKKFYSMKVEAVNVHIDPRFLSRGPFKDTATVKISVEDFDEPPIFLEHIYIFEVYENAPSDTVVGRVHAKDPDAANSPIRYSIDRHTDLDRFFSINPEDGVIKTTKGLDREESSWHNISVIATELHNRIHETRVPVAIKVLDKNDNAPEFAKPYEAFVCENAPINQEFLTITAIDKDDTANGLRFFFSFPPEIVHPNPNFTIVDKRDNTASIRVGRGVFSRQKQDLYLVPVVISDGGSPPMSSTNTLSVRICSCNSDGSQLSCNAEPQSLNAGLSTGALIAILACIVILLVIVVLFVTLRREKKEPLIVFEEEDIRENIITYDDEGGGEEDTEAFDIATLQNPDGINGFMPRKDIKPEFQYNPRDIGIRPAPNSVDVDDFINTRIHEADNDPTAPPYDSIQIYGYEGRGSVAGSLSSLESASTDSDLDYDYLQNWGPRFKKLADLYGSKDMCEDDS
uniref:Cadherin 11 n=1 Tax=Xenopus tropicalis TaxID=8364 RepID=A0A6I8RK16_XENTR